MNSTKIIIVVLFAIVVLPITLFSQRKLEKEGNFLIQIAYGSQFYDFIKDSKLKELIIKADGEIIQHKIFDKKGRMIKNQVNRKEVLYYNYDNIDSVIYTYIVNLPSDTISQTFSKVNENITEVYNSADSTCLGKHFIQNHDGILIQASYDPKGKILNKRVEIKDEEGNVKYESYLDRKGFTNEYVYETKDSIQYRIENKYGQFGLLKESKKKKYRLINKEKIVLLNSKGKPFKVDYFDEKGNIVQHEVHLRGKKTQIELTTYDQNGRILTKTLKYLANEKEEYYEYEYDNNLVSKLKVTAQSNGKIGYDKNEIVYLFQYSIFE